MADEVIEKAAVHKDDDSASVVGRGRVTTNAPKKQRKQAPKPVESDRVLVYSSGNVNYPGVGEVKLGFNVVSKAAAEKWTKLKKVREATVEEVKEFYGV